MAHQGLSPIMFESVSAVTATNSVDLGTRRTVGGYEYLYVYNGSTETVPVGNAAIIASGSSGYTIAVSAVTMVDFGVGIVKHAAIPTLNYGWLMTRGFAAFNSGASDSFAVGNPLAVAVSGVFAHKTISTGYVTPVVGKCVGAVASGNSAGGGVAYFNFGG
jgi:hypothetical protein